MNKERFHNALALSLGYERIVKDKRITIQVDDSDDPWVTLKFQGRPEVIRIKASCEADAALAASVFHFGEIPIMELKEYLKSEGINVRL